MFSLLCPENRDCCEDMVECMTFWLVTFWFRLTAFILAFPFFYIFLLLGALSGVLIDFITCYSCRTSDEKKRAAVEGAMQSNPECDFQLIDKAIHSELEQLAVKLSNKYPQIRVVIKENPFFVDGRYYQVHLPAHYICGWRLDFYSKSEFKEARGAV